MYNLGDASVLSKPRSMSEEVARLLGQMVASYCHSNSVRRFVFSLHGGEPLLVGSKHLRHVVEILTNELDSVGCEAVFLVQTNATLVDSAWIRVFNELGVQVSASIDGPPELNDMYRVDHRGQGSSAAAIRGIKLLREEAAKFGGVLVVANPKGLGADVVDFLVGDLGVSWFDLLLPDATHDNPPLSAELREGLTRYLVDAFDAWFPLSRDGVVCRLFESIIGGLLGMGPSLESIGSDGLTSVVCETDGSLEPHDVLRICQGFNFVPDVHVGPGGIERLTGSEPFLAAANSSGVHADKCRECLHFDACRGGHAVHRYSSSNGFVNPSFHCETLYDLIGHIKRRIASSLTAQLA